MTIRITSGQSVPTVTFYLQADVIDTDPAPAGAGYGRWKIRYFLQAVKPTGSSYLGPGTQAGRGNNVQFGAHSANPFLPSASTGWTEGPFDVWVNASSTGYWSGTSVNFPLQMHLVYGTVSEVATGSIPLPRIARVPSTPVPAIFQSATANSLSFKITGPADSGGSPITAGNIQVSRNVGFTDIALSWNSVQANQVASPLDPGTDFWVRYRWVNATGASGWSTGVKMTTLPAVPPGMVVTPSLSGTSASVTLTPPPGVSSVTSYRVERRPVGGTATVYNTPTSPLEVPGLTPGDSYEWRASAFIGSYQTPWTVWTTVGQPQPNTSPGDYFDGNTPAKLDTTYGWLGTVNNSMSRAIGKAVTGWGNFASGNAVSGGTGAVYRVTGGRSQGFAARVDFFTSTAAAGFHSGIATDVASSFPALEGALYPMLMHVRLPVRGQRMAGMILWVNDAGVEMGRSVGDSVLASPSDTAWVPLRAQGTPPAGATRGVPRVIDVAGPGWSAWQSGDALLMDDVISPFADYYFDGNTPDTGQWLYVWDGAVNASPSRRLTSLLPPADPLLDPDCPPVPPPPRPPAIPDSCVEDDVTEWRQFWQDVPALYVPTWVDSVPILRLEATTNVRLVRVRYYPNPFDRPLAEIEKDSYCSEQIISFIPAGAILTLDGVSERAWAEVAGSSATLAADHLLRGNDSEWPVLGCGVGYYITVDVPTDLPSNSLGISYSLVQRY